MNFYCIKSKNKPLVDLLKKSCDKYKINFVEIDERTYNYTKELNISKKNILYRASTSDAAKILEEYLSNRKLITLHSITNKLIIKSPDSFVIHQKENIPIPKTINYVNNDRTLIKKYVKYLGGFPIIIKIMGGMGGEGIMKVDSLASLFSMMDYLISTKYYYILREFIDIGKPVYSYRAIVLGDKVEIVYKNINVSLKDDFRSNIDQKKRKRVKTSLKKKDEKTIIKSVKVLDIEFGAVDFVFDKKGDLKIFEVNFPFNFVPVVKNLGYNINDKIVEYLIKKTKK